MAKLGALKAAELSGKSKSTIQRAMNSGKLSYSLDDKGHRVIDVSELERVFGIKTQTPTPAKKAAAPIAASPKVSEEIITESLEKEKLKIRIKMLEQQLDIAQEQIDDLKNQRDKWEKQASQVLLTSQYSQKQAQEMRDLIQEREEREERARHRRLQNAQIQKVQKPTRQAHKNTPYGTPSETRPQDSRMKKLKAHNENASSKTNSVFRFWGK